MSGRRALIALGVSVVAVFAGDLGVVLARGTSPASSPPPATGGDARSAVISALAGRPEDSGGRARYSSRLTAVSDTAQRVLYNSEGIADFRRGRARGQFLGDGGDGPKSAEFFTAGTAEYTRQGSGPWIKKALQPNEVGSPVPTEPLVGRTYDAGEPVYARDTGTRRQIFGALVSSVDGQTTEMVHSVATRHYRVGLDMRRADAALAAPVRQEMGAWAEDAPPPEIEVWVDGAGRLARSSVVYPFAPTTGFRVDTEWWDRDEAPAVDVPSDLDDPTVLADLGTTSVHIATANRGDIRRRQGDAGFSVSVSSVGGLRVAVTNRRMGSDGVPVSLLIRLGPEGAGSLPRVLDYRPFGTRDLDGPWWQLSDPSLRCGPDQQQAGRLSIEELLIDSDGVVVRFRASFSVACPPTGGSVMSSTGEIRFHALG